MATSSTPRAKLPRNAKPPASKPSASKKTAAKGKPLRAPKAALGRKKLVADRKPAKQQPPLTGKQRRHLRGLGHALEPIVLVGKGGVTQGLIKALDQALFDHELVKVKLGQNTPEERDEAAVALAEGTKGVVAQVMGNTILVYRRSPDMPKIVLPRDTAKKA